MVEIKKETIYAYALKNAVEHEGKAQSGSVLSSLFAEGLDKSKVKDIMPQINEILKEVNSLSLQEQEKKYEEVKESLKKRDTRQEGELPELPNAEMGKVVMRVAPFPSGPLHIGNARQVILNDEYVKKYQGKLILVIDDTIGSEAKPIEPEAYKMIPESFDWLGINYDKKIVYKSDRLQTYYDYAEELIKKGYMYVCSCPQEQVKEFREKGKECSCRNLPSLEQLNRWKQMFKAKEGDFTVRLKTNMQDSDPAFRDRIMFRISDREHPKVGRKFRVWPLLEFSWAIDDHLLGMTHIIRGVELIMETRVESFIWDIFKWKHPETIHTGLLRIDGVKLSKSKGSKEVKSGAYLGWNDPRLWSLQSLRDRGILPEAIRTFIKAMGITKSNSTVSVEILYTINRKLLEKTSPRYFFVSNPVKIHIAGCPELESQLPFHASEDKGFRIYRTNQDFYISKEDTGNLQGNYRLIHLLNFKADKHDLKESFSFISQNPEEKLKVKYLQWVPADTENVNVEIRMPDNSIITGLAEPAVDKLNPGSIIQFERFGFVRLYKLDKKNKKAEFWMAHK